MVGVVGMGFQRKLRNLANHPHVLVMGMDSCSCSASDSERDTTETVSMVSVCTERSTATVGAIEESSVTVGAVDSFMLMLVLVLVLVLELESGSVACDFRASLARRSVDMA